MSKTLSLPCLSEIYLFQALQEQQAYEKESSLAAIRFGQKKLLEKLKEYKGEELEVVQEAIAFAGETVEDNNDLLLPPYPSRASRSVVSDKDYLSSYGRKTTTNGVKNELGDPRKPPSRVKALIGTVAKAAITFVGVISVISLAGYEPTLRKRGKEYKLFGGIQQEKNGNAVKVCPPGKVPVVEENGKIRCLVKTRKLIPMENVKLGPVPDFNYVRG